MWYGIDYGDANVGVVLTVQRWNGSGWAGYSQGGIGDTDGNGSLRYDTSPPLMMGITAPPPLSAASGL